MKRKIFFGGLASACIALAAPVNSEGAKFLTVPENKPGYVTFTFDDATLSQYTRAFPVLKEAGIPATLYVNVGAVDAEDPFFMSWDQVRFLDKSGWEVSSHGMIHKDLTEEEDIILVGNLELASLRLEHEVGKVPRSFASPFGEYDERTIYYIDHYFDTHVRAWGSNEGVNGTDVKPLFIERLNVDGTLTATEVCSMVQSVREEQWLVLMFHQIGDADGAYISSPEQLEKIARCVSDATRKKGLIVDTVSAVYDDIHTNEE